jgi:hypothetical protein
MGCCIGGPFALKLIEQAQAGSRRLCSSSQSGSLTGTGPCTSRCGAPGVSGWRADRTSARGEIEEFGLRLWRDDLVVRVSRGFVRSCHTPLVVLPGTHRYHPLATGREIAVLSPFGEVFEPWKDSPRQVPQAAATVRDILQAHTPRDESS